jgi:hypothetical protein
VKYESNQPYAASPPSDFLRKNLKNDACGVDLFFPKLSDLSAKKSYLMV